MYEYMCRKHKNEEEMHTLTHHSMFCLQRCLYCIVRYVPTTLRWKVLLSEPNVFESRQR